LYSIVIVFIFFLIERTFSSAYELKMLLSNSLTFLSALLVVVSGVESKKLPSDHILWGRGGKPTTLARRAAEATPAPVPAIAKADGGCSNGPLTRFCWKNGYSVFDDFDMKWPTTGVTRKYNFVITNTTCAPDGIKRTCSLINGQYPGPTIFADWGDMIQVTVKNELQNNGTGLHWHGIRQLNSNSMDGAPGVTECPLAPGDTKTYTFQATQVGSSRV
jgi:Multicopper oxidase